MALVTVLIISPTFIPSGASTSGFFYEFTMVAQSSVALCSLAALGFSRRVRSFFQSDGIMIAAVITTSFAASLMRAGADASSGQGNPMLLTVIGALLFGMCFQVPLFRSFVLGCSLENKLFLFCCAFAWSKAVYLVVVLSPEAIARYLLFVIPFAALALIKVRSENADSILKYERRKPPSPDSHSSECDGSRAIDYFFGRPWSTSTGAFLIFVFAFSLVTSVINAAAILDADTEFLIVWGCAKAAGGVLGCSIAAVALRMLGDRAVPFFPLLASLVLAFSFLLPLMATSHSVVFAHTFFGCGSLVFFASAYARAASMPGVDSIGAAPVFSVLHGTVCLTALLASLSAVLFHATIKSSLGSNTFALVVVFVLLVASTFSILIPMSARVTLGHVQQGKNCSKLTSSLTSPEELTAPENNQCFAFLVDSYRLTPREHEVALLLIRGRSLPYIQRELSISKGTAHTHLAHIYQKLDVHDRQEFLDLVESMSQRQKP